LVRARITGLALDPGFGTEAGAVYTPYRLQKNFSVRFGWRVRSPEKKE
jgi:hypothetical protein